MMLTLFMLLAASIEGQPAVTRCKAFTCVTWSLHWS